MQFAQVGVFPRLLEFLENEWNLQFHADDLGGGALVAEYNDNSHVIEFQLSRYIEDNGCTLAVRFSLCSFATIDSLFIDFVQSVLSRFDAEVWLMTSALKQKDHYPPGEVNWLVKLLPEEIEAMRKYWQRTFGTKQGVVRVKDSFAFVGIG